ncbi:MAG: ABC transporter permease [Lachnospiraceae bacterium]|jgi:simple sugar transport system permease protein|nr:ABC transporter permease [Lachnospiraceae bacterium]
MLRGLDKSKVKAFLFDNIVTIIFVVFIIVGIIASSELPLSFYINELMARFFRNAFLVLALIIPVMAGLGLNFGIVVGALAGMLSIIAVRFFDGGGIVGLLICFLIALPLAILFGFLTGKLFNKTRGQEMIASLIVGYFADGVYQFIVLFAIGGLITVAAGHPMMIPGGVGILATFDMGAHASQISEMSDQVPGLKYALDWIWRLPFSPALIAIAVCILIFVIVQQILAKRNPAWTVKKPWVFWLNIAVCIAIILLGVYGILFPRGFLWGIRDVPMVTGMVIIALCLFTHYFTKTKLGQDCRSVGQSQHIATVSGINVDRTRIIATIFSTVLAAWGMIIFLQNIGTVNTYAAHRQIGMFSVAALLVGGATTAKASVKNALIGVVLFNAMFIVSPAIGRLFSGNEGVGEYTRSFMVYGVIGLSLGLYIWKGVKAERDKNLL